MVMLLVVLSGSTTVCGRPWFGGMAAAMMLRASVGLDVREIESADGELLVLRAPVLVCDENRAAVNFLEEEALLQEDEVERLRRRHVRQVHLDGARRAETIACRR